MLFLSPSEFLGSVAFSVHRHACRMSPFNSSPPGAGKGLFQKGLRYLIGVDIKPD